MSPWKGWSEAEVRQAPISTGFTAINASTASPAASFHTGTGGSAEPRSLPPPDTTSAVSDYLGRGETDASSAAVDPAPSSKKGAGKGRKRAGTATSTSKAKRRKSSNISDGMSVTKPGARQKGGKGATDQQASVKTRPKRKAQPGVADDAQSNQTASDAPPAVAVYAQTTSMDNVPSIKQPTSLDAVRASKGYGQTIYSGSQAAQPPQNEIQVSQPWLTSAASSHSPNTTPQKRTDRRNSGSTKASRQPPPSDAGETDLLLESLGMPSTCNTSGKTTKSTKQLPTPVTSDQPIQEPAVRKQPKRQAKKAPQMQTEEDYLDSDDSIDAALAEAADTVEDFTSRLDFTPPPRRSKDNIREVDPNDDYGGAFFDDAEKQLLDELKKSVSQDTRKPKVRKPFPSPILDRSPIFGASNGTILRTCFRVGEAMNVGCQAVRTNKTVLLELYARVTESWREEKPGHKQHFLFKDLYHDNPPHINGSFELWNQSKLWELDSNVFLSAAKRPEGIMCRVMARMRRDGTKWRLEVLNIWEACWEDVDYVAGIYTKDSEAIWTFADDDD
jgi:hypothetical protein